MLSRRRLKRSTSKPVHLNFAEIRSQRQQLTTAIGQLEWALDEGQRVLDEQADDTDVMLSRISDAV